MGTVVATWRAAPRPAGASMLVGPDGTAVGSVRGGCVEGAVYDEARDVVENGVLCERRGDDLTLFVNSFAAPAPASTTIPWPPSANVDQVQDTLLT
jgi:xanthine/CO dehydrogenase XdhC/CoxF family maturation factor